MDIIWAQIAVGLLSGGLAGAIANIMFQLRRDADAQRRLQQERATRRLSVLDGLKWQIENWLRISEHNVLVTDRNNNTDTFTVPLTYPIAQVEAAAFSDDAIALKEVTRAMVRRAVISARRLNVIVETVNQTHLTNPPIDSPDNRYHLRMYLHDQTHKSITELLKQLRDALAQE